MRRNLPLPYLTITSWGLASIMNVLAIDQGTSSTKALVVNPGGSILGEAEVAVHPRAVGGGGVEQDPMQLWQSVLDAGKAALRASHDPQVGAVGLANQGETVLAWDRGSGKPLSAAISWQDRRAAPICERLREHGDELRQWTGLTLDPYFVAPKIVWLRENVTRDGVVTTTDTWLLHKLTGAFVTDAATASRTLLLDLDSVRWSRDACALFGVPLESLPSIVDCATHIGETSAFGPPLPVTGIAVDQQAALFAEACFERGDAKCTYGTGAFLLASTGAEPQRSSTGLASCVAWQLGGKPSYCLDGQVYTVGAAVDWMRRLGLLTDAAELDVIGASVDDSGGVIFVPALAGLAAPFWQPNARGSFVGLSLGTEPQHLVRALLNGIAAQVAWLARAVASDLGTPLTRLRVDGGLTRSRALMQTQADLLQARLEVYASPHATALGVAALAQIGSAQMLTPAEAIGSAPPSAIYEPTISPKHADERLQRWRASAEATGTL
ncbi:MAG TPA: FGGY family carbohydrate kinase [Candidatus Acidoferrales bacterium]|nr:FGGY family carbohydrate kinase [Candidatus Acidoferrales bacterium]